MDVADTRFPVRTVTGAETPRPLLRLDYYAPPPPLNGLVTTFFHLRHEGLAIRDIQPAAVGQIQISLSGRGELTFGTGDSFGTYPVTVLCPCSAAASIAMEGPLETIGAALSPIGWATFTGLAADRCANRLLPGGEVFGPRIDSLASELRQAARDGVGAEELCARLGSFLLSVMRPVNPRHVKLIRATADWLGSSLNPKSADLYAAVPYSPRQAQRLIERYFGLPPRELRRKYRAIRAATLMALDHPSEADLIATAELFADQSHMIREIRHFVGRTPGKLAEETDSILAALLDIRNFRLVKPQVAAMPKGIGENDSQ